MAAAINRPIVSHRAAPTLNSGQGGAAAHRVEFLGDIKGLSLV
ncbi:hypothetical protein [Bradyrhizobium septentrionale]|uniref:Uncharacterized protein n=1 Tax=Bradyrhizobium septentrionale TaxID=1404411 RepID=A0ABZ2NW42_9BRAD|nr:hypothetical protein [Bradyrhizobium septentrionale]